VTLTESWTGTNWRILRTPTPPVQPPGITYLQGISCATASDCLATGARGNPANLYPLGEFWNGSAWHITHTGGHAR
jgi:hypothetical protein